MKVLLVVDRRFTKDGTSYLTEGPRGPETGERYLAWFDKVVVAGRRGRQDGVRPERLNRVSAPGLSVEFLPNIAGLSARARNLGKARQRLESLVSEADCVIARLPGELPLEAAYMALEMGKPFAVELGGCVLDGMRTHGSLRGRIYAPLAYRRLRSLIGHARWVSYVTTNFLQERYPPAPDAETLACSNVEIPVPDQHALEQRRGRAPDKRPIVFGTIGSLHGRFKGIQHAITALSSLTERKISFEYRVLGGGNAEPWRELVAKHGLDKYVRFDGTIPAGEPVLNWLDEIDVYLHPSLREGLPRAVIEAMSRGCPVIASSVAGTPELLPPECLHAPGDVGALSCLVEDSLSNEWRSANAERNWHKAHDYARPSLEARRSAFWGAFAQHVRDLDAL